MQEILCESNNDDDVTERMESEMNRKIGIKMRSNQN